MPIARYFSMRNKYTKELLEPVIKNSTTWAQVCRELGVTPATGAQTHLAKKAKSLGIDCSHFVGQAWSKGKTLGYRRPTEAYLSNEFPMKSDSLKKRLIAEKYKEAKCESCGIIDWLNSPAPLELDHINGNHFDNSLKNLQILCPNCHAQKTNGTWWNRETRQV